MQVVWVTWLVLAGKLYFTNSGILWSSDGTADGTIPVDDPVISEVQVFNIEATNNNLFLSGYTYKYGIELYAGKVDDQNGKFVLSRSANEKIMETSVPFSADTIFFITLLFFFFFFFKKIIF